MPPTTLPGGSDLSLHMTFYVRHNYQPPIIAIAVVIALVLGTGAHRAAWWGIKQLARGAYALWMAATAVGPSEL